MLQRAQLLDYRCWLMGWFGFAPRLLSPLQVALLQALDRPAAAAEIRLEGIKGRCCIRWHQDQISASVKRQGSGSPRGHSDRNGLHHQGASGHHKPVKTKLLPEMVSTALERVAGRSASDGRHRR